MCVYFMCHAHEHAHTHTHTHTHSHELGRRLRRTGQEASGWHWCGGGELDKERLSHTAPTSYQEGDPELEEQGVLILTEESLKVQ